MNKWEDYEESSSAFARWLNDVQEQLSGEIALKTTLDEKKGQLQVYRNVLQDIKSQKPVLDDLSERVQKLPEKSDKIAKFLDSSKGAFNEVLKKAQSRVEKYEAIVGDHQQYTKAVMDASEWMTATLNTVDMWGDTSLERLSLHANLERLKSLQLTMPEEEFRITAIKNLGEKVIPGTIPSGQNNIRIQIDSSHQEWQGLVSTLQSYIEGLEAKLKQWSDLEAMRESCLAWMKNVDTSLHTFNLKPTLDEKQKQLQTLINLQGEIKAKELEVDAITEKTQNLNKGAHPMRSNHLTELTVKYQHISSKAKDLVGKWQLYVKTHNDYVNSLIDTQKWIAEKSQELAIISEMPMLNQDAIEVKIKAMNEFALTKDVGFGKIQHTIELAQSVLANTAPEGHDLIKSEVEALQQLWSNLASQTAESKLSIDDAIHKWSGYLDQVGQLKKTIDNIETSLKEISVTQGTQDDLRRQIDLVKTLEEKMKCEKIEVDQLRGETAQMRQSGLNNEATVEAMANIERFDKLGQAIQNKVQECENQHKDFKAFKVAQEGLAQYLQRLRYCQHKSSGKASMSFERFPIFAPSN